MKQDTFQFDSGVNVGDVDTLLSHYPDAGELRKSGFLQISYRDSRSGAPESYRHSISTILNNDPAVTLTPGHQLSVSLGFVKGGIYKKAKPNQNSITTMSKKATSKKPTGDKPADKTNDKPASTGTGYMARIDELLFAEKHTTRQIAEIVTEEFGKDPASAKKVVRARLGRHRRNGKTINPLSEKQLKGQTEPAPTKKAPTKKTATTRTSAKKKSAGN